MNIKFLIYFLMTFFFGINQFLYAVDSEESALMNSSQVFLKKQKDAAFEWNDESESILGIINAAWFLYSQYGHVLKYLQATLAAPEAFNLTLPVNIKKYTHLKMVFKIFANNINTAFQTRLSTKLLSFVGNPISELLKTTITRPNNFFIQNKSFFGSPYFQNFENTIKIPLVNNPNMIVYNQADLDLINTKDVIRITLNKKDSQGMEKYNFPAKKYLENAAHIFFTNEFIESLILGYLLYPHLQGEKNEGSGAKLLRTVTFNGSYFDKFLQKVSSGNSIESDKKVIFDAIKMAHAVFTLIIQWMKSSLTKPSSTKRYNFVVHNEPIVPTKLLKEFDDALQMGDDVFNAKKTLLKTAGVLTVAGALGYLGYRYRDKVQFIDKGIKDAKEFWNSLKKREFSKIFMGESLTEKDTTFSNFFNTSSFQTEKGGTVRNFLPWKRWTGAGWDLLTNSISGSISSKISSAAVKMATASVGGPIGMAIGLWSTVGSVVSSGLDMQGLVSDAGGPTWKKYLSPENMIGHLATSKVFHLLKDVPIVGSLLNMKTSASDFVLNEVKDFITKKKRIVPFALSGKDLYLTQILIMAFNQTLSKEAIEENVGAGIFVIRGIEYYQKIGNILSVLNKGYDAFQTTVSGAGKFARGIQGFFTNDFKEHQKVMQGHSDETKKLQVDFEQVAQKNPEYKQTREDLKKYSEGRKKSLREFNKINSDVEILKQTANELARKDAQGNQKAIADIVDQVNKKQQDKNYLAKKKKLDEDTQNTKLASDKLIELRKTIHDEKGNNLWQATQNKIAAVSHKLVDHESTKHIAKDYKAFEIDQHLIYKDTVENLVGDDAVKYNKLFVKKVDSILQNDPLSKTLNDEKNVMVNDLKSKYDAQKQAIAARDKFDSNKQPTEFQEKEKEVKKIEDEIMQANLKLGQKQIALNARSEAIEKKALELFKQKAPALIDANKNKNEVVEKKRQNEFMQSLDSVDLKDKKLSEQDQTIETVRTGILALQKDIKNLENGLPLKNAAFNDALEKINNDASKNDDQKKVAKQHIKDYLNTKLSQTNKMRDQLLSPIDQLDPRVQEAQEEAQAERYNRATNIVKKLNFSDTDFVDNGAVKT